MIDFDFPYLFALDLKLRLVSVLWGVFWVVVYFVFYKGYFYIKRKYDIRREHPAPAEEKPEAEFSSDEERCKHNKASIDRRAVWLSECNKCRETVKTRVCTLCRRDRINNLEDVGEVHFSCQNCGNSFTKGSVI